MADLAALAEATRNPILALPACRRLLALDPETRAVVADILRDLATEADQLAEESWRRRKGPMAAYWRAVCTYAKHLSRAVRRPEISAPAPLLQAVGIDRMGGED